MGLGHWRCLLLVISTSGFALQAFFKLMGRALMGLPGPLWTRPLWARALTGQRPNVSSCLPWLHSPNKLMSHPHIFTYAFEGSVASRCITLCASVVQWHGTCSRAKRSEACSERSNEDRDSKLHIAQTVRGICWGSGAAALYFGYPPIRLCLKGFLLLQ